MTAGAKTDRNNHLNHNEIASRAYAIYVAEGCPDCRAFDHWQQAERELLAEQPAKKDGRTKPKATKAGARSRSKSRSSHASRTKTNQ